MQFVSRLGYVQSPAMMRYLVKMEYVSTIGFLFSSGWCFMSYIIPCEDLADKRDNRLMVANAFNLAGIGCV